MRALIAVLLTSCAAPMVEPIVDAGMPDVIDAGTRDAGVVVDAGIEVCDASCVGCCLNGRCLPSNEQNEYVCGAGGDRCRPCSLAEICDPRGCVPRRNPDGGFLGAVGSSCADDTNCGSDNLGQCFREFRNGMFTGWHGGYCSRTCRNTSCPTGSTCVTNNVDDHCYAACDGGTDCRTDYACVMNVCVPQ